jgi:hypothetical protein
MQLKSTVHLCIFGWAVLQQVLYLDIGKKFSFSHSLPYRLFSFAYTGTVPVWYPTSEPMLLGKKARLHREQIFFSNYARPGKSFKEKAPKGSNLSKRKALLVYTLPYLKYHTVTF